MNSKRKLKSWKTNVCFKRTFKNCLNEKSMTVNSTNGGVVWVSGIAGDNNESGADCLTKVKVEVRKLDVNVADCDRAHRVGRKTDARCNVVDCRQMIVRFTTWRARTEVYRSRDKHGDISFYIDIFFFNYFVIKILRIPFELYIFVLVLQPVRAKFNYKHQSSYLL